MKEYLEIPDFEDGFPIVYFHQEGNILSPPHWHEAFEIIHVLVGELTIGVESELITLKTGESYIINSGLTHYVLASPDSVRLVFLIEPTIFNEMKNKDKEMQNISSMFKNMENYSANWSKRTQKKISTILIDMYYELVNQKIAYKHQVIACLHNILVIISREIPIKKENQEGKKSINNLKIIDNLVLIYSYIEHNFKENISINDISDLVGYTPSYFTRYFKKNTGQTFVSFLNEYRVQKAKWLLSTTEKQSIDIGIESGFQSRKNFHHVFKDLMKVTPLEYREKIRNEKNHIDN